MLVSLQKALEKKVPNTKQAVFVDNKIDLPTCRHQIISTNIITKLTILQKRASELPAGSYGSSSPIPFDSTRLVLANLSY